MFPIPFAVAALPPGVHIKDKKFTALFFLGYLIQAKPPLNLEVMLRLTLNHFNHSFEA